MLTQVEIFTSGVSTPPIAIVDQDESRDLIQISNIEGLGPVVTSFQKVKYADADGELVLGTSKPSRNIVLTLLLNPDWKDYTIEDLRWVLYQYFMTSQRIEMRFSGTNIPKVSISGYVETMTPFLFEKDPKYQVSIMCEEPDFVACEPTVETGIASNILEPEFFEIRNKGNIETGFVLDIKAIDLDDTQSLRMVNETGKYQLLSVYNSGYNVSLAGDFWRLSTVEKDLYSTQYFADGTKQDLIDIIDPESSWVKLRKNVNRMGIFVSGNPTAWTMTYHARFGGL